jgi:hypothetical protein
MLKRSAAIILIILYTCTVSGFALNLHYCFNRLSSIQIDAPSKGCTKGLAVSKMKCCKDKHIEIKVKDSHQTGTKSPITRIFNGDLAFISFGNIFFKIPGNSIAAISYRGPPDVLHKSPLFLKNCTFRI